MINVATEYNCRIIRVWSIAGHGKGEVDHVGGLGKVAIRRAIAGGEQLECADDMIDYLEEEFGDRECPRFYFK